MPAKSEKQKRFFGAVMGAKKGQSNVSGEAKKVAEELPKKKIKKFLKTEEEDEQSISKQMREKGKVSFDGPEVKERKHFAPPTKTENPKKGKGSYNRKKLQNFGESAEIAAFIDCVIENENSKAFDHLKKAVEIKLSNLIEKEMDKPLF